MKFHYIRDQKYLINCNARQAARITSNCSPFSYFLAKLSFSVQFRFHFVLMAI